MQKRRAYFVKIDSRVFNSIGAMVKLALSSYDQLGFCEGLHSPS